MHCCRKARQGDEFEIAFAEARTIITSMSGRGGLSLSRSIESPGTSLLLVEWERLEDHTIGFRQSAQNYVWRGFFHQFNEPFPLVENYRSVLARSN